MRLGEISFCNRIGFNIKCDETKKAILEEMEVMKQKVIHKHHDKYDEAISVPILQSNPHLMTLRSNGNPYYLYLTTYNGVNQCIFIDRKVQQGYFYPRMVVVKFWFNDELFASTIFSGEMVGNNDGTTWTFLIGDLVADSGADMLAVNLVRRINRAYDIISTMFTPDPVQDVCTIQIKRFFHYEEHQAMLDFRDSLPYTSRGIYFKPLFLRFRDILFNFDDTLVKKVEKEKYKSFQMIDSDDMFLPMPPMPQMTIPMPMHLPPPPPLDNILFVQKTNQPDIFEMFLLNGESSGIACVNGLKTSKMLRERFAKATPVDKIRFKCMFNSKFKKWVPIEEVGSHPQQSCPN